MLRPLAATLIVAALAVLLNACGREPSTPAINPPLSRPVVTLSDKESSILIPRALIVERGGLPGVLVLNAEGVARFRLIRTGRVHGGRVEIVSGLTGNEMLVAGELNDVHDGSTIYQGN